MNEYYTKSLKEKSLTFPSLPGIYIFKDINRKVLYVGKAIKLKARIGSYFDKDILRKSPKTRVMVSQAIHLDYVLVNTEAEALILENQLIKLYSPKYNISLKDDKNYKYIVIQKDKTGSYKLSTSRKKTNKKARYFGPYPNSKNLYDVLKDIRKIFPYRNCSIQKFNTYKKKERTCLYGDMGLCHGPCISKSDLNISSEKSNNIEINRIVNYLKGDSKKVINSIEKNMQKAANTLDFEKASYLKGKLNTYNYLVDNYKNRVENLKISLDILNENNNNLRHLLNLLIPYYPQLNFEKNSKLNLNVAFPKKQIIQNKENLFQKYLSDFRIEFYDVSNTGSAIIVGAMVVSIGGIMNSNEYRKFNMPDQFIQDDFKSMQKMISRRFNNKNWPLPNLIVIDGGKGQISAVKEIISFHNIPFIGLAKKYEDIIVPKDKGFDKITIDKNSPISLLMQDGRNEAHRFSLSYNRNLRTKNLRSIN